MNMVRTVVKRESWSEKIVKAIMYVISGAIFATYLREHVSVWLETQNLILRSDLTINIIAIALGYLVAGLIIYMLKHRKNVNIY